MTMPADSGQDPSLGESDSPGHGRDLDPRHSIPGWVRSPGRTDRGHAFSRRLHEVDPFVGTPPHHVRLSWGRTVSPRGGPLKEGRGDAAPRPSLVSSPGARRGAGEGPHAIRPSLPLCPPRCRHASPRRSGRTRRPHCLIFFSRAERSLASLALGSPSSSRS